MFFTGLKWKPLIQRFLHIQNRVRFHVIILSLRKWNHGCIQPAPPIILLCLPKDIKEDPGRRGNFRLLSNIFRSIISILRKDIIFFSDHISNSSWLYFNILDSEKGELAVNPNKMCLPQKSVEPLRTYIVHKAILILYMPSFNDFVC